MSRILPVAATAALTLALGAGSALAQDWQTLARQDLQAAHDELAANHPAPVVPGQASDTFRAWPGTTGAGWLAASSSCAACRS